MLAARATPSGAGHRLAVVGQEIGQTLSQRMLRCEAERLQAADVSVVARNISRASCLDLDFHPPVQTGQLENGLKHVSDRGLHATGKVVGASRGSSASQEVECASGVANIEEVSSRGERLQLQYRRQG